MANNAHLPCSDERSVRNERIMECLSGHSMDTLAQSWKNWVNSDVEHGTALTWGSGGEEDCESEGFEVHRMALTFVESDRGACEIWQPLLLAMERRLPSLSPPCPLPIVESDGFALCRGCPRLRAPKNFCKVGRGGERSLFERSRSTEKETGNETGCSHKERQERCWYPRYARFFEQRK